MTTREIPSGRDCIMNAAEAINQINALTHSIAESVATVATEYLDKRILIASGGLTRKFEESVWAAIKPVTPTPYQDMERAIEAVTVSAIRNDLVVTVRMSYEVSKVVSAVLTCHITIGSIIDQRLSFVSINHDFEPLDPAKQAQLVEIYHEMREALEAVKSKILIHRLNQ